MYRAAFVPVTVLILIGAQLGIARAALDHTIAKAPTRGVTHTNYDRQTESTGFQIQIAEAAMKIETATLHAFRAALALQFIQCVTPLHLGQRGGW